MTNLLVFHIIRCFTLSEIMVDFVECFTLPGNVVGQRLGWGRGRGVVERVLGVKT